MGTLWFFIVMLLDAIKGVIPVIAAVFFTVYLAQLRLIHPFLFNTGILPVLAAIFVILGHSKSVFLEFTGGKSVATGVGTLLALNWITGLSVAAIWGIITYTSKYVSLGSIIALAISPFLMWIFNAPLAYTCYCALGALYIIWLHRSNIQRLIKGEENKVR